MNSRDIILSILIDINSHGAYSNYCINKHLKDRKNAKDENLIREIVYGVVENLLYIDYIISKSSKIKLKKIHPKVLEILRMGVYQIVFMDKIPDRAAVNEAVNLAKKYGHRGVSGFVNGVLRNISRNKEELITINKVDDINYLSIKYSYPKWMIEKWVKEFGYNFTEKLCEGSNTKPKLNIRVNTLKIDRDRLIKKLGERGIIAHKTDYAKDGLILDNPMRVTETEEFQLGYFIIQDESSMLVSQIANPKENSLVLDLCSAPGGKSTHLGQLMNNKGKIISRDIYDHKLNLVKQNANRLGIDIIKTERFDATCLDENLVGKVDYCIVDAPCSGLGIIRRRPEIKWNRKEEDIEQLKEIQIKILNNAKRYIKPGGIIIYSTCTIMKEENIDMVNSFLDENLECQLIGFEDLLCSNKNIETSKKGYIQLFPHLHNIDGFFIAKIQKNHS
jgi:16S rRNA (cytosine967-C5)-methyltransferase